jgi:ribonuclease HIII
MAQQTVTLPVDSQYQQRIRDILAAAEFDFFDAPHAFYRAKGPGCTAVFYRSGKLVLQGPNAQTLAAVLGLQEPAVPEPPDKSGGAGTAGGAGRFDAAMQCHPDPKPDPWIGQDEVGKGDYFGPLVVVSVCVARDRVPLLEELGVTDSKLLKDRQMRAMANDLRAVVSHQAVVLNPEAYNRLYDKIGNLNHLLAWAHARALEDLLAEAPASYALVDKFANERVLQRALMEAGRSIHLEQRTKAESDPAVATASILARDIFLGRMDALSRAAEMTIPRGAGSPVLAAGRKLVAKHGPDALGRFAKLHFKTSGQILRR